jgi:hypothetical protein
MLSSLDLWIYAADDWEQKGKGKYSGQGRDKKYNKNGNYNSGSQNKRSRVRFPVKQIPNYQRFPASKFDISFPFIGKIYFFK